MCDKVNSKQAKNTELHFHKLLTQKRAFKDTNSVGVFHIGPFSWIISQTKGRQGKGL